MKTTTITLEISEEMERKLIELGKQHGRSVAAAALEIITQALYDPATTTNPNDLPYEVWRERFEAWIKRVPQINTGFVDDSRETIYEGR